MARTTIVTQSNCKFEQAENIINNILSKNGFKQTTINSGENVWKKGTGFLTAMQFIKIDFSSNEFTISAWVQAGLGSVGGNEMDLTGGCCHSQKTIIKCYRANQKSILKIFKHKNIGMSH